MPKPTLPLVFLLTVPALLAGQSKLDLQATPVNDSLLVEVLNGGELQELNKLSPATRKDLALRLYSVGHSGSCVEQTEWVCTYHYVLAVSEYGEIPTRTAYDLGEVGEIGNIRWLPRDTRDHAVLELEVRTFPEHAARQNPKLKMARRRYRLEVTLSNVTIRLVP